MGVIPHYRHMQPTLARAPFYRPGGIYEEKCDGWRLVAHKDGPIAD
jgi:hypothetical protein